MQACCTLTRFFPYHDTNKSLSNSWVAALHKQYRMHPTQSPLLHIVSQQHCLAQDGSRSKSSLAHCLARNISSATFSQHSYRASKALQNPPSDAAECLEGSYSYKLSLLAGGWLSKDSSRKSEEAQQLSFSFAAQVQDKAGPAPTQSPWHILASTGQLADEAAMLRQALAGLDRQGGLYLTPVLYRPTVQV